ncbi:Brefeldin A-inhibited guanine nucleotide-exchange protein 2 [Chytridiales sp. JEL 0842]|nr:Brefeldin A-inhibited guanine nucleotide-exchange protein 2 [Chytridiales sp. JEL 0842]
MADLIKSCLDKLLVETTRMSGSKELKESITASMEDLAQERDSILGQGGDLNGVCADPYWKPFKIACASSQPAKIREVALDSLQKLFAHQVLRGALPLPPGTLPPNHASSSTGASGNLGSPTSESASSGYGLGFLGSMGRGKSMDNQNDLSHLDASTPTPGASTPTTSTAPTLASTSTSQTTAATSSATTNANGTASTSPTNEKETTPPPLSIPAQTRTSSSSAPTPFLIDDIIHTVCTTFTGASTDDFVQLQVLKVLLSAVTSTSCKVHHLSLLKVLQTCFNIYVHSRSGVNQVTAKASLTQMVNLVFARMERYSEVLERNVEMLQTTIGESSTMTATVATESVEEVVADVVEALKAGDGQVEDTTKAENDGKKEGNTDNRGANGELEKVEPESMPSTEPEAEPIAAETVNKETTPAPPKPLPPRVIGMLEEVDASGVQTPVSVVEPDSATAAEAPALAARKLTEESGQSSAKSPKSSKVERMESDGPNPYDPTVAYYNTLLRKDAFLVFRLLCRLSTQTDHGNTAANSTFNVASVTAAANSPSDDLSPQTVRARSLALELILSILNNAGLVLQTHELYADLVKRHLTASISRNAVTTHPALFELSLSIFLMVLRFYRSKLKPEVQVLLNTVYLHILEMGNSTFQQKSMVLQALQKMCENPQILADLYLNYDCDLATVSLFERIVSVCARVAQGKVSQIQNPPLSLIGQMVSVASWGDNKEVVMKAQDKKLRMGGALCLLAIVYSLVEWSAEVAPGVGGLVGGATSPVKTDKPAGSGETADSDGVIGGVDGSEEATMHSGTDSPATQVNGATLTSTPQRSSASVANGGDAGAGSHMRGNSTTVENATKTFLDALAPTSQSNPVLVIKNPLHSVIFQKGRLHHGVGSASNASLDASRLSGSGSNTVAEEVDPSQIEELATRKLLLKQGVQLFAQKPKKGVAFFIKHGFVAEDHAAVATFLASNSELNKHAIGDYIGEGEPFPVKVMHAFVDLMDFSQMGFVEALRGFLQTFRLPGESQKIDRIMEKFADRYCENNPDVFAKADTAYTLAFSVIMLNTDLHSSQIKNRMDKPAFFRNNRGINDNADLPDEFLGAIYDEIHDNEIIMEEEHSGQLAQLAIGWGAGDLNEKQRLELYRKEIAHIQKKSQQQLTNSAGAKKDLAPYRTANQPELARPMFAMASWPLMATFSLSFEAAEDEPEDSASASSGDAPHVLRKPSPDMRMDELCLQGFAASIRVASIFRLETERDAFVTSLSKLTGLSHVSEIKPKNVKAIRVLIGLSHSLGEHLESTWRQVLKVISHMERLQLIGNRDSMAPPPTRKSLELRKSIESSGTAGGTTQGGSSIFGYPRASISDLSPPKPSPALEKLIAEFSSQSSVVAIDRIFTNTTSLSAGAIIHFFRAVCYVSLEEVGIDPNVVLQASSGGGFSPTFATPPPMPPIAATTGQPRMYLLQKIVEIAYYNMHRIRYEWAQIWKILQPHFNTISLHPNPQIATFAVDSLRQLSVKFLEREELGHFSTQGEFLRSFEWMMRYCTENGIRELIISSIAQMISARAASIRSGWKPIFAVLSKARPTHFPPSLSATRLLMDSFNVVQTIFEQHIHLVLQQGELGGYVSCVTEFALLKVDTEAGGDGGVLAEVVRGAVELLGVCARQVVLMAEEEGQKAVLAKRPSASPIPPVLSIQTSQPALSPRLSSASLPHPEDHFFLKCFPILTAFSRIIIDCESILIRTRSMECLFDTLKTAKGLLEGGYWRVVNRSVVLPIFEDLCVPSSPRKGPAGEKSLVPPQEPEENDDATEEVEESAKGREGNSVIWVQGLRLLVDLYTECFDSMSDSVGEVIGSGLELMLAMLKKRDEKLATTGEICLHQFLQNNIAKFSKAGCWNVVIDAVEEAFDITNPKELISVAGAARPPMVASSPTLPSMSIKLEDLDFEHVIVKCVTHIEVLQAVRDVFLAPLIKRRGGSSRRSISQSNAPSPMTSSVERSPSIPTIKPIKEPTASDVEEEEDDLCIVIELVPPQHRLRLLKKIYNSYIVARTFNSDLELRQTMWKRGFVQQMPNLVKQETISVAAHLRVLFAIYRSLGDPSDTSSAPLSVKTSANGEVEIDDDVERKQILETLSKESVEVLERFVGYMSDPVDNVREIGQWGPVVVIIFKELIAMDSWWVHHYSSLQRNGSVVTIAAEAVLNVSMKGEPVSQQQHRFKGRPCEGLKKHMGTFYRLGVKILNVDRVDVRQAIQEFLERVGEELFPV